MPNFSVQSNGSGSLQMGSNGPRVSALQSKLNSTLVPSPNLKVDGIFGMKTAQAVRAFQQRRGLVVDGIVGPKTAAALGLGASPGGGPNPVPGGGGGGGGGFPVPPGVTPPQPGGNSPPGFVDLSAFNVVIEAIISGFQRVAAQLLSWIDSDYVPQIVYDRVAGPINGAVNNVASRLRGITRNAVAAGQDPAGYVTDRIREILANGVNNLVNATQPLVGLPIIGGVAMRYQAVLRSLLSQADSVLNALRAGGHAAQGVATRIAAVFDSIVRQLS
ncbi:MAG TPA: peptidoglycan-binding domain-containing protein [Casimicrobium sp.]|nr:peptidoglycan-binding domain-containing protein [Casimicrobium sp.]